jgi:hypothetical protein
MIKALVIALAALAFGTSAMAQDRTVVREHTRVERTITDGSRHHRDMDRHDRMDRRDRHHRMDRRDHRDRGHHSRYHCHKIKKVVYRDGHRRVVFRKKCHSGRH